MVFRFSDIELAELMIEFADNEHLWRKNTDYRAKGPSIAAEGKLTKMFMQGWADKETAAKAVPEIPDNADQLRCALIAY